MATSENLFKRTVLAMRICFRLHNIGLVDIKPGIQAQPPEKWLDEQRLEYEKHPELSVNLIRARKMIVPEIVPKMILQHHTRFDPELTQKLTALIKG